MIDRFDILYGSKENRLQTTYKPLRRIELANYLNKIDSSDVQLNTIDQFNLEYLINDNWEFAGNRYNENDKSWWNLAYNKKSDLLYFDEKNFTMRINPVINFEVGSDTRNPSMIYTNTRGIEAQGTIDNRVGFYTFLTTTQLRVPQYVGDFVRMRGAYPYEGFYKIDDSDKTKFDIFHARGYFTFNLTKSIDVQAGHDASAAMRLPSRSLTDWMGESFGTTSTQRVGLEVARLYCRSHTTCTSAPFSAIQSFPVIPQSRNP